MKISIDDLRDKYLQTKFHEKGWIWTYYVRRPISYYLAIFFLYFNISANKVTLLFLFTGIIGSLLLAIGDYMMFIVGALLIELAIILDCVDGNIARVKGSTKLGIAIDTWSGELILVLSMFMLGMGLSLNDDLVILAIVRYVIPDINSNIFIYIGFISSLSTIFGWAIKNNWQVIIKNTEGLIAIPRKNTFIIENIFHYSGAYSMTMLVTAIFNILDFFLLLIAIIYSVNLIVIIYDIIKKAKNMNNQ